MKFNKLTWILFLAALGTLMMVLIFDTIAGIAHEREIHKLEKEYLQLEIKIMKIQLDQYNKFEYDNGI